MMSLLPPDEENDKYSFETLNVVVVADGFVVLVFGEGFEGFPAWPTLILTVLSPAVTVKELVLLVLSAFALQVIAK